LEHILKKCTLCVLEFLFLNLAGFMDHMYVQTSLCVATDCYTRSPSLCWWSLLPAIYSTILQIILHHILQQ
jgi:hypothetical protein